MRKVTMEITNLRQQAKAKAAKYCAYQERTQQQVRDKLYQYGLYSDAVEEVLAELITDGFINEERYAQAFSRGKFGQNKWGRVKIEMMLRQKGLSNYCIQSGLKEIAEEDYRQQLRELLNKKWASLDGEDDYTRKNKTVRYLMGKGYEPDLIWSYFKD
ncbi:regulatory protein [Catalinimonas alkaloidigena]|uniref:regulatory protein RecX n=1 Tax=Catalinimonas alkaloidigena TaxID=1075417 RepID=UPI0024077384|nr:regulatory protein RecX [Catalinimonas alkaloidigena]MDF9800906.1 regulatory protein [Catalinimonas alkaloidigena]